MEAVLVLVTVLQRWRVSLRDTRPLALTPSITLRPRDGIVLDVSRRRP